MHGPKGEPGSMSSGRGPVNRARSRGRDRGRDAHFWAPPAQHRTGGIPACGSHLGCLTAKRSRGQGCRMRGLGSQSSASFLTVSHLVLSLWPRRRSERRQRSTTWSRNAGSERPCCTEAFQDPFGRCRGFDHATQTNCARPSSFIRLSDLTAIATSVARRASWRHFNVSPMTRL